MWIDHIAPYANEMVARARGSFAQSTSLWVAVRVAAVWVRSILTDIPTVMLTTPIVAHAPRMLFF